MLLVSECQARLLRSSQGLETTNLLGHFDPLCVRRVSVVCPHTRLCTHAMISTAELSQTTFNPINETQHLHVCRLFLLLLSVSLRSCVDRRQHDDSSGLEKNPDLVDKQFPFCFPFCMFRLSRLRIPQTTTSGHHRVQIKWLYQATYQENITRMQTARGCYHRACSKRFYTAQHNTTHEEAMPKELKWEILSTRPQPMREELVGNSKVTREELEKCDIALYKRSQIHGRYLCAQTGAYLSDFCRTCISKGAITCVS